VNLSARQFEQPGLAAMVAEVLADTGFPARRLCLEITETTLMSRAQSALDTLHALKALGVALAVDDFGTGYSSLAYLQRFPVDTLKIDKSLIDNLPADRHANAIVAAVLGLAGAMEMAVIVEGVEHEAQASALRAMGCKMAQGWLYAKGEPNADFVARLSANG
jgi:EAL domain-containing protein (putative c-di-GMP-specific phosphodiesterase class I)